MRGPIAEAVARVASRPRLVLALAALNVLFAVIAAHPLSAALAPAIDARPAASGLLTGDDGLYLELFSDNPAIARVAGAGAELALFLYGLVAWLLAGGVLATLAQPGAPGPPTGTGGLLAATGAHAGRMLKIGAAGLLLRPLPVLVATGAYFALKPAFAYKGFRELELGLFALGVVFALGWSVVTVVIDYARALVLADPALGVFRALGRACRLAWRRSSQTCTVAAFSVGGFAVLTATYHLAAYSLPNAPAWSFGLLVCMRLGLAYARAWVAVVALVAAGLAARR